MLGSGKVFGFVLCCIVGAQSSAFGWGSVGHNAIAMVAEGVVTQRSQQRIKQILGKNSLVDVSTWPDMIRHFPEWQHTAWYHFTSVPDNAGYMNNLPAYSAADRVKGDVVLAMVKAETVLRDGAASPADKRSALAFLVHFVGDVHQPFHTGREEDKGGNMIALHWMGARTNLHAVWDSKLIETSYLRGVSPGRAQNQAGARAYLQAIGDVDAGTSQAWMRGYYDSWNDESVAERAAPYSGYDGDQEYYRSTYIEVVNRRVLQAGYRLGALLNSIFDPGAFNVIADLSERAREFRISASAALGPNFLDRIMLKPRSQTTYSEAEALRGIAELPPDCPDHQD